MTTLLSSSTTPAFPRRHGANVALRTRHRGATSAGRTGFNVLAAILVAATAGLRAGAADASNPANAGGEKAKVISQGQPGVPATDQGASTGKKPNKAKARGVATTIPAADAPSPGGAGYRFTLTNGVARVPVVVVGGTPYQMGWQLGHLMREEIRQIAPVLLAGFKKELNLSDETLDHTWATTAGYTDARVQQELVGLAEGCGLPVRSLQHIHALPLLLPYSCSSIAAWGSATADGHLYQTRNLDWSLRAGAHEFPALVVHLPLEGQPHVTPSFAGFVGAHCGMNAAGIVLSEMGDAKAKEQPYGLHAPHFTAWFRTLLYDADSLTETLALFRQQPQTKRYHFVFGDGRTERKAVKIRTGTGERNQPSPGAVSVWADADATDELAPNVLSCVVYQDEGRGAFPTLRRETGKLDSERLIALANSIPIKGGNVMNAVFDATDLRVWVSYAGQGREAYQRPYVQLDLRQLDGDHDGRGDLVEGGVDRNGNGVPDFLDAR